MMFYEVSAKTSDKVENAFLEISKKLMAKRDESLALKKKNRKKTKETSEFTT